MAEQTSSGARWIVLWRPGKTALLAIACALAQAAYGYDSNIDALVPQDIVGDFGIEMPLSGYTASQFGGGVQVTFGCGAVAGAILTIFLGDVLGRKKSVAIGAAATLIGCILQVSASGSALFATGRILGGIGCGFNSASAPVWQVEAAETRIRGRLILLQLVAKAVGSMVASWVVLKYAPTYLEASPWVSYDTHVSWRVPIGMQLILTIILLLIIPPLPESPRWLLKEGRIQAAEETVGHLLHLPPDDARVQEFLLELSSPEEYGYQTPWQLFKNTFRLCCRRGKPRNPSRHIKKWRRLLLGTIMQFFAAWAGFVAFQQILSLSTPPIGSRAQTLLQYASSTLTAVFAVVSVACIESLGRRCCLLIGFGGQSFCCLLLLCTAAAGGTTTSAYYVTLVGSTFGQCFAGFNYGLPWLYQMEINAWEIRLIGSALAQIVQFISGLTLTFAWSYTFRGISRGGSFAIPLSIALLAVLMVLFLCPETTGRTPRDLDRYYSNGPPWLVRRQKEAIRVRCSTSEETLVAPSSTSKVMGTTTEEFSGSDLSSLSLAVPAGTHGRHCRPSWFKL